MSVNWKPWTPSVLNGQVENADFSDIADFISPTFINPCFRYSPIVNIENTDVRKSRIFKHLPSEYRKLGFQKIRDFQTSMFSIFTISRNLQTSPLKHWAFFSRYSTGGVFHSPSVKLNPDILESGNLQG